MVRRSRTTSSVVFTFINLWTAHRSASPISDWRTGAHWDMGRSINDDTIQSLSTSSIRSSPHSEWMAGIRLTLDSHRTQSERRKWPVAIHFQCMRAKGRGKSECHGEWCGGGLMPQWMLGAARGKFKMAVSVTDFGIRCTHKEHRIIWRMADFCENLRLLGARYGVENTVCLTRLTD